MALLQEDKNYIALIVNLAKSSGLYALASLTSPLVSLVLAPFLTHNLSGTDYGALAVLTTVIALAAGLTQLGLGSAFFRSYNYDYEEKQDRAHVLSTVVILLSLVSFPVALASIIAAPALASLLLKSASFSDAVKLAALAVLMQNMTVPGFSWLRAENRALFFSLLSIVNLCVVLVVTIVLVGFVHMGIEGSLIATAGGCAVVVLCTLPPILLQTGIHLRADISKGLLAFGLPNVASFISVWVLQLSDRYLLTQFGSLSQTGSYNIAYTLGGVLSTVIITPFSLAWPTAMYAVAKKDNAPVVFRLVFRWFGFLLLLTAYGLSLVSTFLLKWFFPPSYQSAAPVIPIVATSIMFYGTYVIFATGIAVKRKTWLVVILTTFSALVNIGCNLLLIPHLGSMGAAISTLIAYVALALAAYLVNQRIYPIPFEIPLFLVALLIGIALYVGSNLLARSQTSVLAWGIAPGALCLYGGILGLLGWLSSRKADLSLTGGFLA